MDKYQQGNRRSIFPIATYPLQEKMFLHEGFPELKKPPIKTILLNIFLPQKLGAALTSKVIASRVHRFV